MMTEPSKEQIDAARAYWSSRQGKADTLATRAQRLYRLIELKAPELIIEQARQLVFKSIMTFPVDEQALIAAQRIDAESSAKEHEALLAAGFYDDVPVKRSE